MKRPGRWNPASAKYDRNEGENSMMKVILTTPLGIKTDLFPEHFSVRQVLEQFQADWSKVVTEVDGEILFEEELDSDLCEFGRDDEVQIHIRSRSEDAPQICISFMSRDEAEDASERKEAAPLSTEEKTRLAGLLAEAIGILGR